MWNRRLQPKISYVATMVAMMGVTCVLVGVGERIYLPLASSWERGPRWGGALWAWGEGIGAAGGGAQDQAHKTLRTSGSWPGVSIV